MEVNLSLSPPTRLWLANFGKAVNGKLSFFMIISFCTEFDIHMILLTYACSWTRMTFEHYQG